MTETRKLTPQDKVLLSDGSKCQLVELSEVRYFETLGNYSKTYFTDGMLLINRTLNYLDTRLDDRYFFRVNRQFIINLSHVKKIQLIKNSVYRVHLSCGKEVGISRRRSAQFKESLAI